MYYVQLFSSYLTPLEQEVYRLSVYRIYRLLYVCIRRGDSSQSFYIMCYHRAICNTPKSNRNNLVVNGFMYVSDKSISDKVQDTDIRIKNKNDNYNINSFLRIITNRVFL